MLERTLAHELEVVRQEICPAGEEEAEREVNLLPTHSDLKPYCINNRNNGRTGRWS